MSQSIMDDIMDMYPDEEFLIANGFDNAIIGVDSISMRLVYAVSKCIDILIEEGMTFDEASEYFEFNVRGAYVGERTPIYVDAPFNQNMFYKLNSLLENHQDINMASEDARNRLSRDIIEKIY